MMIPRLWLGHSFMHEKKKQLIRMRICTLSLTHTPTHTHTHTHTHTQTMLDNSKQEKPYTHIISHPKSPKSYTHIISSPESQTTGRARTDIQYMMLELKA